jgi:L-amino acid N-acyltransferase YncA
MMIRTASEEDWPKIWPLWHAVVAGGDTYMWSPDTDEPAARTAWMLPPPAVVYVAEDHGQVWATALLKPNQPGLGDHVANAAFMVDPGHAGRGIGRKLAQHVLDDARRQGYTAMQFNAVVATNHAAIALWRSVGFRILATVPEAFRHRAKGLVDVHVMFRELR